MSIQILAPFHPSSEHQMGEIRGWSQERGGRGTGLMPKDGTVQGIKLTLDFQFALGTEIYIVSEGNKRVHNAVPKTPKEICLGGAQLPPMHKQYSPLPSLPCYSLPQTRTPREPGHCVLGKNSSAVQPVYFTQTFLPLQLRSVRF